MQYRKKMVRRKDRKVFGKTAGRSNSKNFASGRPMRGGIRL